MKNVNQEKFNEYKIRTNRYRLMLIQMLAQDAANDGNHVLYPEQFHQYVAILDKTEQNHPLDVTKEFIPLDRKFHMSSFPELENFMWNSEKITILDLLALCCQFLARCEKEGVPEIEQYIDEQKESYKLSDEIVRLLKNTTDLLKETQL